MDDEEVEGDVDVDDEVVDEEEDKEDEEQDVEGEGKADEVEAEDEYEFGERAVCTFQGTYETSSQQERMGSKSITCPSWYGSKWSRSLRECVPK